jgi:hypothetical protein
MTRVGPELVAAEAERAFAARTGFNGAQRLVGRIAA